MKVYNMNPSSIYTGLKDEITEEVDKLMPKAGGTFTGAALDGSSNAGSKLRNIAVKTAAAGVDGETVNTGNIIMVRK